MPLSEEDTKQISTLVNDQYAVSEEGNELLFQPQGWRYVNDKGALQNEFEAYIKKNSGIEEVRFPTPTIDIHPHQSVATIKYNSQDFVELIKALNAPRVSPTNTQEPKIIVEPERPPIVKPGLSSAAMSESKITYSSQNELFSRNAPNEPAIIPTKGKSQIDFRPEEAPPPQTKGPLTGRRIITERPAEPINEVAVSERTSNNSFDLTQDAQKTNAPEKPLEITSPHTPSAPTPVSEEKSKNLFNSLKGGLERFVQQISKIPSLIEDRKHRAKPPENKL